MYIYINTTTLVMGLIKECVVCGSRFDSKKHKEKKTCSKECLKIHSDRTKEERIMKSKVAFKEKYGVEHNSQLKGFSENVKKTKLEKYGDENFNNREKAKNTLLECNGVDNPMQILENVEKSKETKKKKYSNPNFNNRPKAIQTNLEKYNHSHHLKNDEILNKLKKTNQEKFGVDFPILLNSSKQKLIENNLSNFGSEYYFSSEIHKNHLKQEKIKNIKLFSEQRNLLFVPDQYQKIRNIENKKVSYIYYTFTCKNCNHTFQTTLSNQNIICRNCYPLNNTSKLQKEFKEFLLEYNIEFSENDRSIISPQEIDFYIPKKNLAIELNGNYYHSELGGKKDKKYHIKKSKLCNSKNINLIHIFEDEWILKKEIVKSRILNKLNLTPNKIYARQCRIQLINNQIKTDFLNKNHIQGNTTDKIRIGLYHENELVSIMTFSKLRNALGNKHKNENFWELNRFCSLNNYSIVGGFEKLLKYFIQNFNPKKIITFGDCRWSGMDYKKTVYHNSGFSYIDTTKPNYFYTLNKDYSKRLHRYNFTKHKISQKGDPRSEWEIMQLNGYDRIWDCGSMKFEINF